ncbi:MAG: hypothetical protein ABJO09_04610 [Hyphomicrobiales bacterium]|uniref:hypothetical protein n=1 Tax=Nisaea sp. TaxID=2024842 RepID=UPI00326F6522
MRTISFVYKARYWIGVLIGNAAIFATLVLAQINSANACACCTEVGQRHEGVREIDDIQRDVLQSIKFASRAELIGNEDDVKGLAQRSFDEPRVSFKYELASIVEPHLLTLELSQDGHEQATISFPLPAIMTVFEVDTRDTASSENLLGPLLYREWQLAGEAILTGMAAEGARRARIRLILQGRGNSCPNSQDFSHWALAAEGDDIHFELIGEMKKSY